MLTFKQVSALLLAALTLLAPSKQAAASDYVSALTEENIVEFLETTRTITASRNTGFFDGDLKTYFTNHLAPKAKFVSKTRFELPGYPVTEGEVTYNKEEFIQNILKGEGVLEDYEVEVAIDKIDISNSGRSATVVTTITETGRLPWPDAEEGEKLIPVTGTSNCEQRLAVSLTNYIQMANADCQTLISFSPFLGRELGE